jgi:hypothetical protein
VTIQLIINIIFSLMFFLWMPASIWFFWKIWQSNQALVLTLQAGNTEMRETILENSRKNVETINELARILEKYHEPPNGLS